MINSTPLIISNVCIERESQYEYGLTISWNLGPCHLHNGADISGYLLRYSPISDSTSSHSLVIISTTEHHHDDRVDCHVKIRGSFTCLLTAQPLSIVEKEHYQFQVAAFNKFGAGPFSEPINVSLSSLLLGSY